MLIYLPVCPCQAVESVSEQLIQLICALFHEEERIFLHIKFGLKTGDEESAYNVHDTYAKLVYGKF